MTASLFESIQISVFTVLDVSCKSLRRFSGLGMIVVVLVFLVRLVLFRFLALSCRGTADNRRGHLTVCSLGVSTFCPMTQ